MLFQETLIINVLKIRFILVGIAGIFHFSAQIVVIKLLFYLSLNTKPSQTKPTNHLSLFKAFQLNILFWLEINFVETSMIPPIIKPNLIDAPFTSFPNYFMKPINTHLQIKSIYTSFLKYLAKLTQKTLLLVYNSLLLVYGIMCVITHQVIIVFYFIWRERVRELQLILHQSIKLYDLCLFSQMKQLPLSEYFFLGKFLNKAIPIKKYLIIC